MYGLHIIQTPTHKFTYVGEVPVKLCKLLPAKPADVMAGRAITNQSGDLVTPKTPVFTTLSEAVTHAKANGFQVKYKNAIQ